MLRWSQLFVPTLREDPKDSDAVSYKLMMRAGLIRRLGAGAYTYLPFGFRALLKAAGIVREEMNKAGAQEILMPAMQPVELWKATGRYALLGDVLIRFKDRTGKEVALGPTHEEVVTDLVKEIRSHRQLPITLYQIQTKFRDEPRPRFGIIRSKEFLMKDAYSFDADEAGLDKSYRAMYDAYHRIFERCGVTVIACDADPGMMGGTESCEFMAPSPNGEDRIVRCAACGYAANLEAAKCPRPDDSERRGGPAPAEAAKSVESVKTPGQHTVEQVSGFLKVSPSKLIKTLIYEIDQSPVAVLVRGDHDVNEAKLARTVGSARVKLAGAAVIERVSGAPVGFAGPVKLPGVKLLADHAVMRMANAVTGANAAETHLVNVNPGRDFQPSSVGDLRFVTPEDACPKCGGTLDFIQAIEVGHVFKLGTKYTETLGASIQDPSGAVKPMIMGCYGIGINRIIASAIEQRHDANGIIWPPAIAPLQVVVTVMEATNQDYLSVGQAIAQELEKSGLEVVLDDREQSPGAKLKDADLVGLPIQVVVGKVWHSEQKVEIGARGGKERAKIERSEVVPTVHKLLDKLSLRP